MSLFFNAQMNMKKIAIIACLFVIVLGLNSCTQKSKYTSSDAGFEYKYLIETNSQKFPSDSTMLFLHIRLFNERDSLLFDSEKIASPFKDWYEKSATDRPLNKAYAMMQEGDSMSFLFNAREYYRSINPQTTFVDSFAEFEKLRFEIKLDKIYTEDELLTNLAKQMAEKKLEEEMLLAEYIQLNYPAAKPSESGMYFIQERQGSGEYAKAHNSVIVHYSVTRINGEPVYSTYSKVEPLKVQVNDPYLYPCLIEALQKMRKGGRAIVIAPSKIAAGEKGNQAQGIPPYTTLIFDMELLSILP